MAQPSARETTLQEKLTGFTVAEDIHAITNKSQQTRSQRNDVESWYDYAAQPGFTKLRLPKSASSKAASSLPGLTDASPRSTSSVTSFGVGDEIRTVQTFSRWHDDGLDDSLLRGIHEDINRDVAHSGTQFERNPNRPPFILELTNLKFEHADIEPSRQNRLKDLSSEQRRSDILTPPSLCRTLTHRSRSQCAIEGSIDHHSLDERSGDHY